jgi:UDP-N-acetylmuramate: L-alanyl-gamma-D-glutamyl-meso-diaminopimelate ligase
MLCAEGMDPGFMIGGLPRNFGTNHRLAAGSCFVLEGDEYDTAYFDKRPKFLHYAPHIAVVTSCEFDHADIYRDLDHIRGQFHLFCASIPETGRLIAFGGDPVVRSLAAEASAPVWTYGFDGSSDWIARDVVHGPHGVGITACFRENPVARGILPVVGNHNVLNALAALAVGRSVGLEPQRALDALGSFQGVTRRQQIIGEVDGITVIDDFAHHPTAVRETLAGVRSRFPDRKLIAVFEPRTNTSRRSIFQKDYVDAFRDADLVVVREPKDVDTIPRELRFSSQRLAEDLRKRGCDARSHPDTEGVLSDLTEALAPGNVVLLMSNGNFDNVGCRLMELLRNRVSGGAH